MKTIKIIDLLNKIANGEAPRRIKVTGRIYEYDDSYEMYYTKEKNYSVALGGKSDEINLIANAFNEDTVEILDVEDEFEDIEELKLDGDFGGDFLINDEGNRCHISSHDKTIVNRINKVIKNQKKIIERLKDKE